MSAVERLVQSRKPIICPKCGRKPVARILYGMPEFSEQLNADMAAGKIVLGGCVVTDDDPDWQCTQCGQQIFRAQK